MKIQVFGSGCPTCKKLYELTAAAAKEAGVNDLVEYLTGPEGIQKIIELGVMSSPVLTIDDKPALTGAVGSVEEIKKIILKATGGAGPQRDV